MERELVKLNSLVSNLNYPVYLFKVLVCSRNLFGEFVLFGDHKLTVPHAVDTYFLIKLSSPTQPSVIKPKLLSCFDLCPPVPILRRCKGLLNCRAAQGKKINKGNKQGGSLTKRP